MTIFKRFLITVLVGTLVTTALPTTAVAGTVNRGQTLAPSRQQRVSLRDSVVIVRPRFHQKTRSLFKQISRVFDSAALGSDGSDATALAAALAQHYANLADSPGHGSGWIARDRTGGAWVVTNKHVAGQADSVRLEWADDRVAPIADCPVVFVDSDSDLAIIRVPEAKLPSTVAGFEISSRPLVEGDEVVAVGFPGVPGYGADSAVYQYTQGIVNNAAFPVSDGTAIQHSATIDSGNSGGPLLVPDASAALKFRVAGVNTWTLRSRTNVNLAIPASRATHVLLKARGAEQLIGDERALLSDLRRAGQALAMELGSAQPDNAGMYNLISYRMVAEHGHEVFPALVSSFGSMSEAQRENFLAKPVEYMRAALFDLFVLSYRSTGVASVALTTVYDQDVAAIGQGGGVRTVFTVDGRRQEVLWVFEHGGWRIGDATFELAAERIVAAARTRDTADVVAQPEDDGPAREKTSTVEPSPDLPAAHRLSRVGVRLAVAGGVFLTVGLVGVSASSSKWSRAYNKKNDTEGSNGLCASSQNASECWEAEDDMAAADTAGTAYAGLAVLSGALLAGGVLALVTGRARARRARQLTVVPQVGAGPGRLVMGLGGEF